MLVSLILFVGGVNSWGADEETNFAPFRIQRTSEQREKGQKEEMSNIILRSAEPKDVSDILRLIKVTQILDNAGIF